MARVGSPTQRPWGQPSGYGHSHHAANLLGIMRTGPRVLPAIGGSIEIAIVGYEQWMADAGCLDVDPELFYPDKGDKHSSKRAKRICMGCPVRDQCLDHAVAHHELFGIWGGKSPKERRLQPV